jgi:phage tail-like protein
MSIAIPRGEDPFLPLPAFAFHVSFSGGSFAPLGGVEAAVSGGFSEITGLEATMEPKVIRAGGINYGAVQRPGPVSFATVVMKRGIVEARHLWAWWSLFAGADRKANGGWARAHRCNVHIALMRERRAVLGWTLEKAMPVKFRVGDLNARGTEVAVEELHLAHEGLHMAEVGR